MFETAMRKGLTYKVLNTGNGVYCIAAVIDTNKVVYSSNLHFVGDVYDSKEDAKTALDRMLCDSMQAGDVRPMRDCIEYSKHIYTSKSSAMRAAKNAIGREVGVVNPQIGNGFDAILIITENMLNVSPCEGGWRWSFSYGQDDVTPYTPCDDNTEEFSSSAPIIEMATVDTSPVEPLSLPELTKRIEFYKDSVKSIAASKGNEAATAYINRELPQLKAACTTFGVTMSDVGELLIMVRNSAKSTDPSSIARVMVKAEPYGLHGRLEQQLAEQASKRRLSVAYCLQSARDYLQRCAV